MVIMALKSFTIRTKQTNEQTNKPWLFFVAGVACFFYHYSVNLRQESNVIFIS